mmetsp:Transcript_3297/g.10088  ORF Transcript_3297/g.10088 Transcript_3297/m.10088 type:complete len:213 (+) Transcript_3297:110-748(+)
MCDNSKLRFLANLDQEIKVSLVMAARVEQAQLVLAKVVGLITLDFLLTLIGNENVDLEAQRLCKHHELDFSELCPQPMTIHAAVLRGLNEALKFALLEAKLRKFVKVVIRLCHGLILQQLPDVALPHFLVDDIFFHLLERVDADCNCMKAAISVTGHLHQLVLPSQLVNERLRARVDSVHEIVHREHHKARHHRRQRYRRTKRLRILEPEVL